MMPDIWAQALNSSQLSLTMPETLRTNLAALLETCDPAEAAVVSGLRSDLPACAFLAGYQVAMRAVDPCLSPEHWACLCVSEKGLRSLSEMSTSIDNEMLSGKKSHAMLADGGMDWFYVIARDQPDIVCRRVKANERGISILPPDPNQPVVPELPHHALALTEVSVDSSYRCDDAHNRVNKPFRYHEDVMTILALSGWCLRMVGNVSQQSNLVDVMQAMARGYRRSADGYSLDQLDAFDTLAEELTNTAQELPEGMAELWQRDRRLLMMGQKARSSIRQKLSSSVR